MANDSHQDESEVILEDQNEVKEPGKYLVILHNDDYTTMEFVIYVLQKFFHKTSEEAHEVMWSVHKKGRGVAGRYTLEIAETKVSQVEDLARQEEFPLRCTIESDSSK
ncbi:MAG: ATP-dependent Clp protease adapter ClpS [Bdellovibrionaceae bacterium]|nr:ATP-dependent Clp protease adapter ClpS [Pseudobdellovibrionaceae bacterium]|tara:strand:- start:533 stop:856 length:324 start_codon:yes stop_codon:yes gene_type:complete